MSIWGTVRRKFPCGSSARVFNAPVTMFAHSPSASRTSASSIASRLKREINWYHSRTVSLRDFAIARRRPNINVFLRSFSVNLTDFRAFGLNAFFLHLYAYQFSGQCNNTNVMTRRSFGSHNIANA